MIEVQSVNASNSGSNSLCTHSISLLNQCGLTIEGKSKLEKLRDAQKAQGNMLELNASFSNVSDTCKDFICKLLTFNPEERPTAAEALQHPWLTETEYSIILEQTQHMTP